MMYRHEQSQQARRLDMAAAAIDAEVMEDVAAWPDPEPLPTALPPVQPFDLAMLPAELRGWIGDISHRMQQPPDFAAVGAVVALSSLIGARAVIRPKQRDDWSVVPNLWGMIVGRPGSMKSPVLTQIMAPVRALEAQERERWEAESRGWEIDCKVAGMRAAANEKEASKVAAKDEAKARELLERVAMPEAPALRSFVVNDTTVEKLGELLNANHWGLLAYRDELYGLLTSLDKQGQEGARAFYLQAYDGNQRYTFHRIGRGEVAIPRVCLSVLGGIQPARLDEYVRSATTGGAGDDGLLQRFGLAVWPDATRAFTMVDQWPNHEAKQVARAVFERIAALEPNGDEPVEWRFSQEAQQLFYGWFSDLEEELRGGELHPAMESHIAKYRKLIPALALIFALVDTPASGYLVGEQELMRALAWGDYLRSHAQRVYSACVQPDSAAANALLLKIRQRKVLDGFRIKQVQQNGWAWLSTTDDVKRAVAMLEDYGWVRLEEHVPGERGGRPGEVYLINPKARADA